jgi:hypothetical protein
MRFIHRDGIVSINELEAFLWPKIVTNVEIYREIGIVVEYSRKVVISQLNCM